MSHQPRMFCQCFLEFVLRKRFSVFLQIYNHIWLFSNEIPSFTWLNNVDGRRPGPEPGSPSGHEGRQFCRVLCAHAAPGRVRSRRAQPRRAGRVRLGRRPAWAPRLPVPAFTRTRRVTDARRERRAGPDVPPCVSDRAVHHVPPAEPGALRDPGGLRLGAGTACREAAVPAGAG